MTLPCTESEKRANSRTVCRQFVSICTEYMPPEWPLSVRKTESECEMGICTRRVSSAAWGFLQKLEPFGHRSSTTTPSRRSASLSMCCAVSHAISRNPQVGHKGQVLIGQVFS